MSTYKRSNAYKSFILRTELPRYSVKIFPEVITHGCPGYPPGPGGGPGGGGGGGGPAGAKYKADSGVIGVSFISELVNLSRSSYPPQHHILNQKKTGILFQY